MSPPTNPPGDAMEALREAIENRLPECRCSEYKAVLPESVALCQRCELLAALAAAEREECEILTIRIESYEEEIAALRRQLAEAREDLEHMRKDAGTDSCADYAARNAALRATVRELREGMSNLVIRSEMEWDQKRCRWVGGGPGSYWQDSIAAARALLAATADAGEGEDGR